MAQEDRNRLSEWILIVREQTPVLRAQFGAWLEAVREEPRLIWETTAVRYATYLVGGLLSVWIVTGVTHALTPPPPASARPEATTADFHAVCSDPACGEHFVINRAFGFDDFPVACPRCGKLTGESARACVSETCRGRWVIPRTIDGVSRCPICNEPFQ